MIILLLLGVRRLIFEHENGLLCTELRHYSNGTINKIIAYADTGCNATYIGSHSLARLLNKDVRVIREQLSNADPICIRNSRVANGSIHQTIRAMILNIGVDGINNAGRLSRMKCIVDINDEEPESPFILIGLDILLRFDKCILKDGKLCCNNFDEKKYAMLMDYYDDKSVKLYSSVAVDLQDTCDSNIANLLQGARGD